MSVTTDIGPFAIIPEWVAQRLSPTELTVYFWLTRHADQEGVCWPGQKRLADLTGFSRQTVSASIKALVDAECLSVVRRGLGQTNLYIVRQVKPALLPDVKPALPLDVKPASHKLEPVELEPDTYARAEEAFENVWKVYPRKVNKRGAWKAYLARHREGVDLEVLARCVTHYAAACADADSQFVMHGSTFFGPNKRYEDFVDPPAEPEVHRASDGLVVNLDA